MGLVEPIRIAHKPVGSEKTLTSLLYGVIDVEDVYLTQTEHREPRTTLGGGWSTSFYFRELILLIFTAYL